MDMNLTNSKQEVKVRKGYLTKETPKWFRGSHSNLQTDDYAKSYGGSCLNAAYTMHYKGQEIALLFIKVYDRNCTIRNKDRNWLYVLEVEFKSKSENYPEFYYKRLEPEANEFGPELPPGCVKFRVW